MEAAPEVQGKMRHSPRSPVGPRAGAHPPGSNIGLPGGSRAHSVCCPDPTQALWHTFNRSNTANTMHQAHQAPNKHFRQVCDHKRHSQGQGCCKQAGKAFKTGNLQPAFSPSPLHFLSRCTLLLPYGDYFHCQKHLLNTSSH